MAYVQAILLAIALAAKICATLPVTSASNKFARLVVAKTSRRLQVLLATISTSAVAQTRAMAKVCVEVVRISVGLCATTRTPTPEVAAATAWQATSIADAMQTPRVRRRFSATAATCVASLNKW